MTGVGALNLVYIVLGGILVILVLVLILTREKKD